MAVRPPVFLPGQHAVFRPNHRSFGEFILSDQIRDVVAQVAGDIADVAKELTQVGKDNTPHVHMRDRYRVIKDAGTIKVGKGFANERVLVKVVNDDPESALEEFGSKYNKRNRMLGRAGARFGDFKSKKGDFPQ